MDKQYKLFFSNENRDQETVGPRPFDAKRNARVSRPFDGSSRAFGDER